MTYAFLLLAAASAASGQDSGMTRTSTNPPVAVVNSPSYPPAAVSVPPADPPSDVIRGTIITGSPELRIITVSPPVMPPVVVPHRPPMPPPPTLRNVTDPQPRAPAQSYVSRDDYPASALAMKKSGRTRVLLLIGPDGRVASCQVVASSGSAALDSATCNLLRRRARFTPARDSNGNPAAAQIIQQIEWRLP